jgi:RNA polymerase sigma factor (sigma-70 family)
MTLNAVTSNIAPTAGSAGDNVHIFERALAREHRRLVALCASITGDFHAAEDLAQETLIEAWRSQHTLRDSALLGAWLSGIARNVCRRWLRSRQRENNRQADELSVATALYGERADQSFDLELEIERQELVTLLDRALALLPAESREVLIERYVRESRISEIAARLGIQTPAAAMRLQRGKLALRQILTTAMRQEIAPYLIHEPSDNWHETRIWCFVCGVRHLRGRLTADSMLIVTCPACFSDPESPLFMTCPEIWGGVKGYGRALARTMDWIDSYYQSAPDNRTVRCYVCGATLLLSQLSQLKTTWGGQRVLGFHQFCPSCHAESSQPLAGLLLASPAGRRFLRAHPRMRMPPEQETELDGSDAVITRFVSLPDRATMTVISARASGRTLRVVHGA